MRLLLNLTMIVLIAASSVAVSAHEPAEKPGRSPQRSRITARVSGLSDTNASVRLAGRVLTPEGTPIRNTMVFLIGKDGVRSALSGSLGYFTINNIPAGENYALGVVHPRYIFSYPSEIIKIHTDIPDLLIVGELNMFAAR